MRTLLLCLFAPVALAAQVRQISPPLLTSPVVRACVTGLDTSAEPPSVVSLTVTPPIELFVVRGLPASYHAAHDAANLLAQDVARQMRELLGATSGGVPDASTRLPWTAVWGSLHFTLRSDGVVSSVDFPVATAGDSLARAGSDLIARALGKLIESGERWPFADTDSIAKLDFVMYYDFSDRVDLPAPRIAFRTVSLPVFSHRLPRHRPIVALPRGTPRYPNNMRADFQMGEVDFAVRFGANGAVEPESFASFERAARPIDESMHVIVVGRPGGTYGPNESSPMPRPARPDQRKPFEDSARRWVRDLRFERGRIGNCDLGDIVEMRVSYSMLQYGPAKVSPP